MMRWPRKTLSLTSKAQTSDSVGVRACTVHISATFANNGAADHPATTRSVSLTTRFASLTMTASRHLNSTQIGLVWQMCHIVSEITGVAPAPLQATRQAQAKAVASWIRVSRHALDQYEAEGWPELTLSGFAFGSTIDKVTCATN